jgi:hypothetical protein
MCFLSHTTRPTAPGRLDHSFKYKNAAAIKFIKQNQKSALPLTKKV